jgi:hypothetical protein
MRISYGRAVYVGQTPRNIIDAIGLLINTVATGDQIVVVSREELISFIDEYREDCDIRVNKVTPIEEKVGHFLIEAYEKMEGEFGDVFFST